MKRSILLSTAALSAAFAAPAFAFDEATQLDDVVITATRIPAIVADTPGARVIDGKTIEQRGAIFAADILSDVPGLSVTRSGAFGGVAQVRMRGATPGKTLVLVDGAPVNDAAEPNGAYDFSSFELADIERIEVLSGPQSSLWGSDAIGGVIAFTTKEIEGLRAEAEAGSFDTVRGRLAAGVANETYAVSAYVSHFDTDGISAADEADGNPEADGFRSTTLGAKGRYAFSDLVKVDGSARWNKSKADLDGFPAPNYALADTDDTQESEQWSGFGRVAAKAFGLNHQFSVSASDLDRSSVSDGFGSTFTGDRQAYRWQANGATQDIDYAFGVERNEASAALSSGLSRDLSITSVFGVAQYDVGALNLTGGLRYDDTDDFGSKTTGRVSAAYDLAGGFILSGAYGTGFKAPTVSQAVCDYCYAPLPWPELKPETADSVEIALGWTSTDGRFDGRATLYRLNVEDQITYTAGRYINVAKTRSDGVELEGRALLGAGFDLTLAYAWTDAEDRTTGARLLRVPEHAGSATLGWTGDRVSGALTVRAEGDQDDSGGFSTVAREGFVTANLNAAYELTDKVTLTARIENLADEHYQQVFGYGEPGRSGYVGVRLRY
ncbi:MAG: TonB-dependent receptor [Brevundimonas sp.]|uniref:TonB-dependent receptor plug domain-containing protein n=1 Tax=Brevundimonas TaxID=41275 RepID=UPI001227838D|nr:TonB-dependent receptor [Brevundimonas sp.]MBJ7320251.1 TonB-dependent receptor [Brevundimonas sp.]TAJ42648.1 MAG: TonB-dependent receptor [Brevundimonas sp.]